MNKRKVNLVVKRTTTGLGLFTSEPIPKDQRIIEYVGPIITVKESMRSRGKYFFELDEDHVIDGSARSNKARYLNHACRPNARAYISGKRIWIWSLRVLKAGEEITIDYGRDYLESYIEQCKCKSCNVRLRERKM